MVQVRTLENRETTEALALVWDVFLQFEAPDYSQEGIDAFRQSIYDPEYEKKLTLYGAFQDEKLVGVLATRSGGSHIALFFVRREYQRQGIGRKLFETAVKNNKSGEITVHSSPFAVPVYEKLGFAATDREQIVTGIRYLPMKIRLY